MSADGSFSVRFRTDAEAKVSGDARMKAVFAAMRRVVYLIWRQKVASAFNRADPCTLFGVDLLITPGVLHPRHFASSRLMGRHLLSLDLKSRSVLDLGTGSGFLALLAARAGAQVLAIDINPLAVSCARENARRNNLTGSMDVLASDVFDGLPPDRRFDMVVTNPPFYAREPRNLRDHAFAAGPEHGFFARLAEGLSHRLENNGRLLMVQSSDVELAPISSMFARKGLTGRVVRESKGIFETLIIREFRTK